MLRCSLQLIRKSNSIIFIAIVDCLFYQHVYRLLLDFTISEITIRPKRDIFGKKVQIQLRNDASHHLWWRNIEISCKKFLPHANHELHSSVYCHKSCLYKWNVQISSVGFELPKCVISCWNGGKTFYTRRTFIHWILCATKWSEIWPKVRYLNNLLKINSKNFPLDL